ncbi:porin family protein [Psychroserpens sp. SPM9]|uniref:porin family protein n=1 Tax=Psychroserpens sp. SPM9 TaxID=2975598 RepID=UPI0021A63C99|nr:porin family protein [Psychroserpens sp. SPM9]MDG5491418.1 porin family protein [Psychroserpens sp. SPM9]
MKKVLLMAAVAVFGFTNVNAQDENTTGGFTKGDVYVSGTVGFDSQSQDEAKNNNLNFSPSVGYFVSENIALEFNLLFGSQKQEVGDFEQKQSQFGAGLGATYFFTPGSQFSFTVGAGVAYVSSKEEEDGVDDDFKVNSFGIAVSPGVNYFVSDCFALRASIGALSYTSSKADFDGAEALNTFGLNLDLSDINFGITYKF